MQKLTFVCSFFSPPPLLACSVSILASRCAWMMFRTKLPPEKRSRDVRIEVSPTRDPPRIDGTLWGKSRKVLEWRFGRNS